MTVRWPIVRDIVADALEVPPNERGAFLSARCGSDHALLAEVSSLLDHADTALPLDLTPAHAAERMVADLRSHDAVGTRLGPYRLTALVAAGGMSAVYRGCRADDQYEKQVAVKIFGGNPRSPSAMSRFHRERQILASLDHPNITRLVDGGTTPEGRPYIVMEFVNGADLVAFAHANQLDLTARLRLFVRICRAVQYAHGRLIVHRDLKPANILVTPQGEVKLLDFGISKLLDDDVAAATATAAAPMTVRYASPEQITGGTITTASDVYALGVVLYELLTDRSPYDVDSSLHELTEAIRRGDPKPPSSHRAAVDAEVDAIVLQALAPSPSRRYRTAEALADDVSRRLVGEPVAAHPRTRWYVLRKTVSRHRRPLAVTAAFVSIIFVACVIATTLAIGMAQRSRDALAARDDAERINAFLAETLVGADPLAGDGDELGLLTLLEDASRRLSSDFEGTASGRGALHATIGRAYLSLWRTRDAAPHLEQAVEIFRHTGATAALADALEDVAETRALHFDHIGAERALRECLTLRAEREDVGALARTHTALARAQRAQGRVREADATIGTALALFARADRRAHPDVVEALDLRARIEMRDGRPDEAFATHEHAMQMRRALYGPAHEHVAKGMVTGATLREHHGQPDVAREIYLDALAVYDDALGPNHPRSIQTRLGAAFRLREQDPERAYDLVHDAIGVAMSTLPDWHRMRRYARSFTGLFLAELGDDAAAEPHLVAALAATDRQWGPDHTLALHLRAHLALVYDRMGRPNDAARHRLSPETRADTFDDACDCCRACGFGLGTG